MRGIEGWRILGGRRARQDGCQERCQGGRAEQRPDHASGQQARAWRRCVIMHGRQYGLRFNGIGKPAGVDPIAPLITAGTPRTHVMSPITTQARAVVWSTSSHAARSMMTVMQRRDSQILPYTNNS